MQNFNKTGMIFFFYMIAFLTSAVRLTRSQKVTAYPVHAHLFTRRLDTLLGFYGRVLSEINPGLGFMKNT